MEFYGIPGCSHYWSTARWKVGLMRSNKKLAQDYLMEVKAVVGKYGVGHVQGSGADQLAMMDVNTAMEEDGILDKSMAPARTT